MLPEVLQEELQKQFNHERANDAIYQAFSHILENVTWDGFSKWFRKQAADERIHSDKVAGYLINHNIRPRYDALEAIPQSSDISEVNPLDLFKMGYDREKLTTAKIKMLHHLAEEQENPETQAFLVWFLNEQVEEERIFTDAIQELSRAIENASLVVLDEKYGR